jgi:hypothetical protein
MGLGKAPGRSLETVGPLRDIIGLAQRLPPVDSNVLDPARGMGPDLIEHVAEVCLRIDLQLLAGRAQAQSPRLIRANPAETHNLSRRDLANSLTPRLSAKFTTESSHALNRYAAQVLAGYLG